MSRTLEYLLTTAIGLVLVFMVVVPAVERVAQAMDNSANMIAEATTHHHVDQGAN